MAVSSVGRAVSASRPVALNRRAWSPRPVALSRPAWFAEAGGAQSARVVAEAAPRIAAMSLSMSGGSTKKCSIPTRLAARRSRGSSSPVSMITAVHAVGVHELAGQRQSSVLHHPVDEHHVGRVVGNEASSFATVCGLDRRDTGVGQDSPQQIRGSRGYRRRSGRVSCLDLSAVSSRGRRGAPGHFSSQASVAPRQDSSCVHLASPNIRRHRTPIAKAQRDSGHGSVERHTPDLPAVRSPLCGNPNSMTIRVCPTGFGRDPKRRGGRRSLSSAGSPTYDYVRSRRTLARGRTHLQWQFRYGKPRRRSSRGCERAPVTRLASVATARA
jgi:hypothetical protein